MAGGGSGPYKSECSAVHAVKLQLEHANGLSVLLTHLYVHSTKQLCTKACDGSNSTVMQHWKINLLYIRTFTPPAIFLFFISVTKCNMHIAYIYSLILIAAVQGAQALYIYTTT